LPVSGNRLQLFINKNKNEPTDGKILRDLHETFAHFKTDVRAEDFVSNADLTEYDLSRFRPMSEALADTERKLKTKTITFRLSEDLLAMPKAEA